MRDSTLTARKPGLTTTEAPFIEGARSRGQLFIQQPYELYSGENHATWRRLYSRIHPRWQRYANEHFLEGLDRLGLPSDRVPRLAEINRLLREKPCPDFLWRCLRHPPIAVMGRQGWY